MWHFTFLLPPSPNRNASSSTSHCENAGCLSLFQPATVVWSPHGPMNSQTMTTCISPSRSHQLGARLPFCSQLVLHAAIIPFVPFICGHSTLLCRFWQTFCRKRLENRLLQRGRTRELSRFVPGCTDVSQPHRVLVYGCIDKLLAGTGRGAASHCAELLVTSWAAAGGTGCFESLLNPRLGAAQTGLLFKRRLLTLF